MAYTYNDLLLPLQVPSWVAQQAEKMVLTIEGLNEVYEELEIDLTDINKETGEFDYPLTQEMTGKLQGCNQVQVDFWIEGKRCSTEKGTFHLNGALLERVVESE